MRNLQKDRTCLWMFLLGLGSETKILLVGVISLSELVLFVVAPFVLFQHLALFRREKVLPVVWLCICMIVGNILCCKVNDVPIAPMVKDSAIYYSIFAGVIVSYNLMRRDPRSLGWFVLGAFFSSVIAVFCLNPKLQFDLNDYGYLSNMTLEDQLAGVMFWYPKVMGAVKIPVAMAYFKMPIIYPIIVLPAGGLFAILSSTSGRGAAAMTLLAVAIIAYCRKSRSRMRSIGKHFVLFVLLGLFAAVGIKNAYVFAASRGLLGDGAQIKYRQQMKKGDSLIGVLMGGRTEFFIAIRACFDAPLIGQGACALDTKGYVRDMVMKYGDVDDIERYQRQLAKCNYVEALPQHSCLTMFWARAGISGLLFWLYVLYLVFITFKSYIWSIPQWFGYLVLSLIALVFTIFFNPYTSRVGPPVLIAAMLVLRSVAKGFIRLPIEMEIEAQKYDR